MWFENLTFGQLVDRAAERWGEADRIAKGLIAAGIMPGEHVSLWLNNCPEYLFTLFAVAKIGAILVPINTRFRTRDVAYVVTQSDATTLIAAARSGPIDYLAMIEELLPGLRAQRPQALSIPTAPALKRVILLN